MNKIKELALILGLSRLPFSSKSPTKLGFKKSVMPKKDYAKRKRRLKISGTSRNINHRISKVAILIFFLPHFAFSQDTIHVKKVFLNGHKVKVKSGYIIHKKDTWEVNGKDVMLWVVKETDKPDFKPETLTAKK